jgi:glutathione S-transferase
MSKLTLVIGNKNYSSWSLRPWLAMTALGIPFSEKLILLDTPKFKSQIAKHSGAGRVPVLHDGKTVVWDTLAIIEYLAERFPKKNVWPSNKLARARARSISAEMHASALSAMPAR